MSKIVCEICGSTYQGNSSDPCPICGWTHNAVDGLDEEIPQKTTEQGFQEPTFDEFKEPAVEAPKPRDIFDFDAVNEDTDDVELKDDFAAYDEDEDDEEDDAPRSNTFLVILLVIVIVILLLTSGYIFFKYFMPNNKTVAPETTAATVQTEEPTTEPTTEATIPTVPCTGLSITSGKMELTKEGQFFLIHVVKTPEDTTDVLEFSSEDESIVTVDADGKVTAVGEGETNIIVKCGSEAYKYPAVVLFVEDLTPPEETTPSEEGTDEPDDNTATEATEAVNETTDPTKQTADPSIEVKLKKKDVTIGRRGVYIELELDCDLTPDQVEWSIGNSAIATVDSQGRVTAVSRGTTIVTVKNGSYEDTCYIRCVF